MHTEAALEPLTPLLGPAGYVVSLQNGLNERVIASRIGAERTVGAFVNFGADYLDPGRIMFGGGGALYLGELDGRLSKRVRGLGEIFRSSVLENTRVTDNIWGYLWGKMAYGAMLFATALADASIAEVLASPGLRPTLATLAGEALTVAQAEGVRPEGFDGFEPAPFALGEGRDWEGVTRSLDRLVEFNRASLKQKSGVWRDLAVRRRKTEVDQQPGLIVQIGRTHGISTPLNARLVELIHDIEDGRGAMSWANLEELGALNARVYPTLSQASVS
jgi:2-dehydropantoate 2-reductase